MEKLNLHEISIPEKVWKEYRNSASEEELVMLGIGVRYKLAKSRFFSWICAIGMIFCLIFTITTFQRDFINDAVIFGLVGYIVFSFLCTKIIRYNNTFTEITKSVSKDDAQALKQLFVPGVAVGVIDTIAFIIILIATIPYQIIMWVVGLFAPKAIISKNGVLVAVPKGYGLDALESIGDYYAGFSFFDEFMESQRVYKYSLDVNIGGYNRTLKSKNDIDYYDSDGTEYVRQGDEVYRK